MNAQPHYEVVVADDHFALRVLFKRVLERSGRFVVVAEAENGKQAVEAATQYQPDLTLLDLSMPVMGGLEALPLIRTAVPSCTVVVVSGFDAEPMADKAIGAGAAAYVVKGIAPDRLVQQLLDMLEGGDPAGGTRGRSDSTTAPPLMALRLPADLASAGRARNFVRRMLQAWARDTVIDDAALLATEVVTNAVVHARSAVELTLVALDDRTRIEVADRGGGALRLKTADEESIGGRGLFLVEELSRAWGTSSDDDKKVVWFEL